MTMKLRALPCCCAAAMMMLTASAQAQVAIDDPSDGPHLVGRGTALTPVEHIAYSIRSQMCPQELRASLVGGDLSDREMILVAVIVGLAVAVVIVAAAD